MTKILIAMNSFNADMHNQYGHSSLVERIAKSGAEGVEIRKELLPSTLPLSSIKKRFSQTIYAVFIRHQLHFLIGIIK